MNSTFTPPSNASLLTITASDQQMLSTTVFGLLCGGTLILLLGLVVFLKFAAPSSLYGYKNTLLCMLLILRASHYAAAAVDTIMGSITSKFARYFLLSATECLYLWFMWVRSQDIIGLHASKSVIRFALTVLVLTILDSLTSALVVFLPLSPDASSLCVNVTTALGGLGLCVVDCVLMYACLQQILEKTQEITESKGQDARGARYLPILAKYGLASTLSSMASLVFYSAYTVLQMNPQLGNSGLSSLMDLAANVAMFFIGLCLVAQKVKLVMAWRDLD
ncbi:hypothetical protein BC830DRAFT_263716 [Chytriomyces sp. MP71]|nr:hypothetical protein BC830DRAFT_263716 [Chytriomyces sp. MP71]